jgi:phospholipid/cholesterol/gamma-HCH transport system substrate-binding protein
MPEHMKNMLIGVFVALAMGLVVAMVLFIKPTVGDGKQVLHVRFSNINGISVGTRVIFAGKAIGEVEDIQIIPNARHMPVDSEGNLYYYDLTLRIDSGIPVYDIDEFTVQTSGLLGDKSVAIIPKAPKAGQTPKLVTAKSIIYAQSNDLLESAYNILSNMAEKVEDTFTEVTNWMRKNGDNLGNAIVSFDNVLKEADQILNDVNQQHLITDFKEATDSFTATMDGVNQAISTLEQNDTFNHISCLVESLSDTSTKIGDVVTKVSDGEGTIGKLFNDDETYLQVTAVLSKANTMMNDINQYGLLFNLNKQWQRSRVKQASLINSLKTPTQFKNYFEGEVDQINTAMGRISLLIDKAADSPNREVILKNPVFKNEFKDLMQQVDALKDALKLYNEYLNEAAGQNNK